MWPIQPRSISMRPAGNMKKTSITCAYFHRAAVHRRQHPQLVQRQRQLLPRPQQRHRLLLLPQQPLLRLHQRRQLALLLLPDPRRRQDLHHLRGRVLRHSPGPDRYQRRTEYFSTTVLFWITGRRAAISGSPNSQAVDRVRFKGSNSSTTQ